MKIDRLLKLNKWLWKRANGGENPMFAALPDSGLTIRCLNETTRRIMFLKKCLEIVK